MSDDAIKKLERKFEEHIADHERMGTVMEAEIKTKVMVDVMAATTSIEDSIAKRITPLSEELKTVHAKTNAQTIAIEKTLEETAKQTPILRKWLKGKKADRKEREARKILDAAFKKWVKRFLWALGVLVTVWEALRSFGIIK